MLWVGIVCWLFISYLYVKKTIYLLIQQVTVFLIPGQITTMLDDLAGVKHKQSGGSVLKPAVSNGMI